MKSSINFGLYSLPTELLHIIHSYLPFEDQMVVSKVSQIWRAISDEKNALFIEFVKNKLSNRIKIFSYNDDQIKIIIELLKANNFIAHIKRNNSLCKIKYNPSLSCQAKIANSKNVDLCGDRINYSGSSHTEQSNSFYIHWNPSTLKLSFDKGKWGDFRSPYEFFANIVKLAYQKKDLFKSFELSTYASCFCSKGELISWQWIENKDIEPPLMHKLIEDAINLQLKMHRSRLAHINMTALSKITHIKDIQPNLHLACNELGRITNDNPSCHLTIKIENIALHGKMIPILVWDSSDLKNMPETWYYNDKSVFLWEPRKYSKEESHFKVSELMRWSIFSLTCKKLAKKLGIQVKELPPPNKRKRS